jgi:aminoglycoside 6-adenylyltransferase
MRSEKEMLDLILGFAGEDERIRAVIMNGSRVNPDVARDIFQDYDIVYMVTDVDTFVRDRSWISRFGQLIIMQTPSSSSSQSFTFLMLFTDGNRIDLTLYPMEKKNELEADSLSELLLDKDGAFEPFPSPSNQDYKTVPPTAKQFADCCNEFWWVSTYIAKGLWRRELSYAKFMHDGPVRNMLILMLRWYIGVQTNFTEDPGKLGKYFERYLEPHLWNAFVRTYPDADYENIWQALFEMGDLFREAAWSVAEHFEYVYPLEDDKQVTAYLAHVRVLPRDAGGVYENS